MAVGVNREFICASLFVHRRRLYKQLPPLSASSDLLVRYDTVGRAFLAVVCLALLAKAVSAQSTNATLSGRITDRSKIRIIGANVADTSAGTNIRDEATTNGAGEYYLPSLLPGVAEAAKCVRCRKADADCERPPVLRSA